MLQAVLFDLDDTLIIADNKKLMDQYFSDLAERFPHHLAPEKVRKQIVLSTLHLMEATEGGQSVLDRFIAHFFSTLHIPPSMAIFMEYYADAYGALGRFVRPGRGARAAVEKAQDLGLAVVLATNSVFPAAAIRHRLAWGDLADIEWEFITDMESMHYCKPQPAYYAQIATRLDVDPARCLMVGNDPANDLPAQKIGMKTFLITSERPPINQKEREEDRITAQRRDEPLLRIGPKDGQKEELTPDYQGSLDDLQRLLNEVGKS